MPSVCTCRGCGKAIGCVGERPWGVEPPQYPHSPRFTMAVSGALFVARAGGRSSRPLADVSGVGAVGRCCCAPVYADRMAAMDVSRTKPGTTAHLLRIVIAPRKRSYSEGAPCEILHKQRK